VDISILIHIYNTVADETPENQRLLEYVFQPKENSAVLRVGDKRYW